MKKKYVIYLLIIGLLYSCKERLDYYSYPTFSEDHILNAVVEIPAGTNKKYEYNIENQSFEIDKKDGVERVIQYLPYIGNYGYIPSTYSNPTKGGDGDALDVLILSESKPTGTIVKIVPIALLKLIDDGELDYKVIAVPYEKTDQIIKATTFNTFSKRYPEIQQIIETWFLNYNKADSAVIEGWGNEVDAMEEVHKNLKQ